MRTFVLVIVAMTAANPTAGPGRGGAGRSPRTPGQSAAMIRRRTAASLTRESDSPAREPARYVSEMAENSATQMHIEQVFRRDRYLRGGDQISFLQQGYP